MKTLLTTLAALLAVPAAAQTAPTSKPKMECCCKKMGKTGKMETGDKSKALAPERGVDPHAGHDMTKR